MSLVLVQRLRRSEGGWLGSSFVPLFYGGILLNYAQQLGMSSRRGVSWARRLGLSGPGLGMPLGFLPGWDYHRQPQLLHSIWRS